MKKTICIIFIILNVFTATATNRSNNGKYPVQDTTQHQDTIAIKKRVEEVTISAFYTPYNLYNIPAPVNYISPKMLKTGDALTPIEIINRVPGIIMHHGTFNTNRLTIRGIGSRTPYSTNKIKAYFGNIPLTSGDGETTLEDLENESIGRVEIIKGPASSLYGAALGGAILFYPKAIQNEFVKINSTAASFNTFKNSVSTGINAGNLNMYALFSNLQSEGYRDNNRTDRNNFILYSQIAAQKNASGTLLIKYTKMKAFIPSSLDWETFSNSPQSAAANWQNIGGFEKYSTGQIGASIKIKSKKESFYDLALFGHFRNTDELRPFNKLEESSQFAGSRGSYQKNFMFNLWKFNFVAGFEVFRESYDWETYSNNSHDLLSNNHEKRNYENLFIQTEFNRDNRLILSVGINFNSTRYIYSDYFTSDGDQSGKYSYDPVFSQRLGFNYKLNRSWSWFGNFSHGFSPPTLQETLLPEGSINPEIKPEQGWNTESGLRGNINNRLSVEMTYYRIYVSDLLVARRTGEDAYVGQNAGQSIHPGFEGAFQFLITKPGAFPSWEISGNLTLSNFHFSDFTDNEIDYSGKNLPGTSKTTFLASTKVGLVPNLDLSFSHRYVGKMAVNDANTIYSNPFGISNIDVLYTFRTNKLSFELKTGINNLFDVQYASMIAVNAPSFGGNAPRYYYPGNPINYFISLTMGYQ